MRLQEALEEAHKDKAFYREIIAGLQGQVAGLQEQKKHLTALIPVWSQQEAEQQSRRADCGWRETG